MNSGIYKIMSPSNRVYIGKSKNIKTRWKGYTTINKVKNQPKIYNSFLKYGIENHKFEIIEECSINLLTDREIHYKQIELDKVGGDFNKVLFCNLYDIGCDIVSEEVRLKISMSLKGKPKSKIHKENLSKSRKGKRKPKRTLEHSLNLSNSLKGRVGCNKGKILSTNHRLHISEALKHLKCSRPERAIICPSLLGMEFKSIKIASEMLGMSIATICDILKKRKIQSKGLYFIYK